MTKNFGFGCMSCLRSGTVPERIKCKTSCLAEGNEFLPTVIRVQWAIRHCDQNGGVPQDTSLRFELLKSFGLTAKTIRELALVNGLPLIQRNSKTFRKGKTLNIRKGKRRVYIKR